MSLAIPSLIFICVLYTFILLTGIWVAKKIAKVDMSELLLAGQNIGTLTGTITITAVVIGGKYTSEIAETVYRGDTSKGGLIWCMAPLSAAASLLIATCIIIGPMRKRNFVTILDPCAERFGTITAAVLFVLLAASELIRLGASLSYFGDILFRHTFVDVGHFPVFLACAGTAVISVTYCSMGGMKAVVYTDFAKFIVIFCGLWLFAPCAYANLKLVKCIRTTVERWQGELEMKKAGLFADDYFALIVSNLTWQGLYQRILSVKTTKQAHAATAAASVVSLLFAAPSALLGAVATSTDWNKTEIHQAPLDKDSEFIFTIVLEVLTPPVIASVGIGVLAVAVVVTFDTSIVAISAMFTTNVFRSLARPQASDSDYVLCFKACLFFCGLCGTALGCSILPYRGFQALSTDLLCCAVFPQIFAALFLPRCNGYGCLCSLFLIAVLRLLSGVPELGIPVVLKYFLYDEYSSEQTLPYRALLTVLCFVILYCVSLVTEIMFVTGRVPAKYDFLHAFNRTQPDLLSALPDALVADSVVFPLNHVKRSSRGAEMSYEHDR